MKPTAIMGVAVCLSAIANAVFAHESDVKTSPRADGHAPIGVMGDHMHRAGEWMVSYRYMRMSMSGNHLNGEPISNERIVSEIANPAANMPPTLRVVPGDMTSDMHMVGVMYAPTDRYTLMAMLNYISKDMTLTTYQGMMGAVELGNFTTHASGVGDTKLGVLVRALEGAVHDMHFNLTVSLPTGAIDKEDDVLTPMNTRVVQRLPYGMQLGSGSYDVQPGITYTGRTAPWSWGAQVLTTMRLNDNDEGYRLGDEHQLSGWTQYALSSSFSLSGRLTSAWADGLSGADSAISAPVQTADPNNYGGERVLLGLGLNWVGQQGAVTGQRLALEYTVPVHQDLHGLQMETDNMLLLGYQYAF